MQRPRFTRRFVLVAGVSSLATFGTGGAVVFARANDRRKRGWGKDVVRRKVRLAVANGELTREQAAEKLRAWRDGDNKRSRRPTPEEMATKLQTMVANGLITQEQADKKLEFTRLKSSEKFSSR